MIVQLLFVAAILAAVTAMGLRRRRRTRLRRAARTRLGSSPERAIAIQSYTEMDEHLGRRWCSCGGYLERTGEGSRALADRRYRVAQLRCQECETLEEVFFDTTEMPH
ncbi:MAG: hypothetical protein U0807_18125 [Candidatus Binatia bacterium]